MIAEAAARAVGFQDARMLRQALVNHGHFTATQPVSARRCTFMKMLTQVYESAAWDLI